MDNNNYQPTTNFGAISENQPYSHSAATPLQGNQIIPKDALETQKNRSILWIIITIICALTAVTFIGLFIWMYSKWNDAEINVNGQINAAVAEARSEAIAEKTQEFMESEKYPYKMFSGPADLGSLTFEYPKTWSLYEEKDALGSNSEYVAYLNPDKIPPLTQDNPLALRVNILSRSFDDYIRQYQSKIGNGTMSLSVHPVGGANANVYTGEINNNFQGIVAVFKIRDKTVVLQTDAMIFSEDFNKILDSVKYNQ